MTKKVRIICADCGSDDVRRDADVAWNCNTQEWELCAIYDQGSCEACGDEVSLEEEEIADAE